MSRAERSFVQTCGQAPYAAGMVVGVSDLVHDVLNWVDEIDLDPNAGGPSLGVRVLGDQTWLVSDGDSEADLALRSTLLATRHDEVAVLTDWSKQSATRVCELLGEAGVSVGSTDGLHPLERAGRAVQEDLCLMHRVDGAWLLDSAILCFPSRWRLSDKIGQPMHSIHDPVLGYDTAFSTKVDRFISRVGVTPVRRRNWFVHPDNALFQPSKNLANDPVIAAPNCGSDLYLRSERQTLRRLSDDWILFTIRIQRAPVADLVDRRPDFARYIALASLELLAHHGIKSEQRDELLAYLTG